MTKYRHHLGALDDRCEKAVDVLVDTLLDYGFNVKTLRRHIVRRILWKARYERGLGVMKVSRLLGIARKNVWRHYKVL